MPAKTLKTDEVAVLEEQVRELRAALEHIRDTAAAMANGSKSPSAVLGFNHLSAYASDALEGK